MKKINLLAVFFLAHFFVIAQNYQWSKLIGGRLDDVANGMDIDALGNIYTIGTFTDTTDFDPGAGVYNIVSEGQEDVFVLKLDASGNFKWARAFGGAMPASGVVVKTDTAHNVFIAGSFYDSMDFDPGVGTDIHTALGAGTVDIFIIKLDSAGNYQWGIQYGNSFENDFATDLTINKDGNVLVTGLFTGTIDFGPGASMAATLTANGSTDVFIVTINSAGNPLAAIKLGGPGNVYPNDIEVDNNYTVYLAGYFNGTCYFNPGASTNTTSTGTSEAFVVKLAFGGNFQWVSRFGGAFGTYCQAADMALNANGDVTLTGYFKGTVDFQPGGGVTNLASYGSNEDIFVCRLNANGVYVWAKKTGQQTGPSGLDLGIAIKEDANRNMLVTGRYSQTIDFDPGVATVNLTSLNSGDIFIEKIDSAGGLIWVSSYGGNNTDIVSDMALTSFGQPVITGYIYDTADFDPGAGVFNLVPPSLLGGDFFVSKSGDCALPYPVGAIIAPAAVCEWSEIPVSVGSSYGATDYNWEVPAGSGIMSGFYTPNISLLLGTTSGTITVVPSNACGFGPGTSVNITVDALPIFALQPLDEIVDENSPASFTANCLGAGLTYNWQKKSGAAWSNLSNNAPYSGVSTNTLNISNCDLLMDGTYFRCVVTSASCPDTTNEALLTVTDTIDLPTGVDNGSSQTKDNAFRISPNPFTHQILLSFQSPATQGYVVGIYSALGQLIKQEEVSGNSQLLNLDKLSSGVYLLRITDGINVYQRKLIKE